MNSIFQKTYERFPETVYALLLFIVIDYITGICLVNTFLISRHGSVTAHITQQRISTHTLILNPRSA